MFPTSTDSASRQDQNPTQVFSFTQTSMASTHASDPSHEVSGALSGITPQEHSKELLQDESEMASGSSVHPIPSQAQQPSQLQALSPIEVPENPEQALSALQLKLFCEKLNAKLCTPQASSKFEAYLLRPTAREESSVSPRSCRKRRLELLMRSLQLLSPLQELELMDTIVDTVDPSQANPPLQESFATVPDNPSQDDWPTEEMERRTS